MNNGCEKFDQIKVIMKEKMRGKKLVNRIRIVMNDYVNHMMWISQKILIFTSARADILAIVSLEILS